MQENISNLQDYASSYKSTWCPGCGNFGINTALKKAFTTLGLKSHEIVMVFGIGCSSGFSS